jgi:hypothetical protein
MRTTPSWLGPSKKKKKMLPQDFLHHLNSINMNIKFTMEPKQEETLPFLDVFIKTRRTAEWVTRYTGNPYTQISMCLSAHHPPQNCYQQSTSAHCLLYITSTKTMNKLRPQLRPQDP